RSAFHMNEVVDRHRFGRRGQARERGDEARALRARLAHAHDSPAAHLDSGTAHPRQRTEPVAVSARGDDLAVELRGRIEVVVVIVETRRLELLRLAFAQEDERRASLESPRLYRARPLRQLFYVFLLHPV